MELVYKRAGIEDLDVLVRTRMQVLKVMNKLDEGTNMGDMESLAYEYYKKALAGNDHTAYLVFDKDKFVASGDISFFSVMPSYKNPTGSRGYIMNIYTDPEYRRKGIAYKVVDLLVLAAREKGALCITLRATKMGRKLYEKYGFVNDEDEMRLDLQ